MKLPGSVLIVDDESHIRKYVSLILRSLGITAILEAADGAEAVTVFQREHPALVLLDVNMPQVDGLKALEQLMAVDPDCVVIMLTSVANRHTVEQALELGAANYVRKDTPKAEMVDALRETITDCFPDASTP
ncbi:response regulator transcription factor [Opitutus sp. ER46]|uniref:response regulator transcription factor n=1 Tax=Opitutus sp. ER46 TaxID=2161864 RepID=UPI000D2FA059|nr:response regulator transcription factor [Opitutus sp. ER46]PTX94244.1 response regulator [Opitutus sp. ER46]